MGPFLCLVIRNLPSQGTLRWLAPKAAYSGLFPVMQCCRHEHKVDQCFVRM